MKEWRMLVWITQLGVSVAAPLAGFTLIAIYAQHRWSLPRWIVAVGVLIGLVSAVSNLRMTLRLMKRMDEQNRKSDESTVSYNRHE